MAQFIESVTITLDHYIELVNVKNKIDNLQEKLKTEFYTVEDICQEIDVIPHYYNEVMARIHREKEGETNE